MKASRRFTVAQVVEFGRRIRAGEISVNVLADELGMHQWHLRCILKADKRTGYGDVPNPLTKEDFRAVRIATHRDRRVNYAPRIPGLRAAYRAGDIGLGELAQREQIHPEVLRGLLTGVKDYRPIYREVPDPISRDEMAEIARRNRTSSRNRRRA